MSCNASSPISVYSISGPTDLSFENSRPASRSTTSASAPNLISLLSSEVRLKPRLLSFRRLDHQDVRRPAHLPKELLIEGLKATTTARSIVGMAIVELTHSPGHYPTTEPRVRATGFSAG